MSRHHVVAHSTVYNCPRKQLYHHQLPLPPLPQTLGSKAVVLGGGIAGLTAAKVLSKYFDNVQVIERDSISPAWGGEPAADAAKYHHLHILVSRGLSALDAVFDGRFVPALQQAGCVISDVVTNFSSYHPAAGRWAQPTVAAKGALLIVQATRHTVEGVTRQLLDGTRGVEVTYGTTVTGLVMDQQQQQQQEDDKVEHRPAHQPHVMQEASGGPHQRVTGVVLADGRQVSADLVVDCSGRQSKMSKWLAAAGVPQPRLSQVDASLGYASWLVRLDPDIAARVLRGNSGLYAIAAYPEPVGAAVVAVEGGLHMAALCTYAQQTPPFDDADLPSFLAQRAWSPIASELLAGSVPVAPASRFYRVASTWRHYVEVPLPEGLIITGDAVCSFNPIYGHGMTMAALEVMKLDELLAARQASARAAAAAAAAAGGGQPSQDDWLLGVSQEFQKAITPMLRNVWDLCVAGDLRFSTTTSTEPPNPLVSSLKSAYFDAIMVVAATDPEVSEQLFRVMHLVDEATELTAPHMVRKVLLHLLKAPFARAWRALQPAPTTVSSSSSGSGGGSGSGSNGGNTAEGIRA